jgi:hypothetical protein
MDKSTDNYSFPGSSPIADLEDLENKDRETDYGVYLCILIVGIIIGAGLIIYFFKL